MSMVFVLELDVPIAMLLVVLLAPIDLEVALEHSSSLPYWGWTERLKPLPEPSKHHLLFFRSDIHVFVWLHQVWDL